MDFKDLALADMAHDYQILHDDLIDALTEAVTYRDLVCACLQQLHDEQIQRQRLERRLRQVMEIEPWHLEEAEA